jgi:hypothetical protein
MKELSLQLFKSGFLRYYSFKSNKQLSSNALWMLHMEFEERGNLFMSKHGQKRIYEGFDFRLYIDQCFLNTLETSILKYGFDFDSRCILLGIIPYIKQYPDRFSEVKNKINDHFGTMVIDQDFDREIDNLMVLNISTN